MSDEPIVVRPSTLADAARPLAARIAALADRLAELLQQVTAASGSDRWDFLREIARQYRDETTSPDQSGSDVMIRLADAFDLSSGDIDLVVLAGLPDEHEGFCDVLRSLHPRGEPKATVALISRLFCRTLDERRAMAETLISGALIRSGLASLSGEAPFPERSLTLADALWPLLRGFDVWPASLDRLPREGIPEISAEWLNSADAEAARKCLTAAEPVTLLVLADDEDVALDWGIALARSAGIRPWPLGWAASMAADASRLLRVHAAARGGVPVLRVHAADDAQSAAFQLVDHPGPVIACARLGFAPVRGSRPMYPLPVDRLRVTERQRLWTTVLPELRDQASLLAARYALDPHLAAEVALDVTTHARITSIPERVEDVADSVRVRSAVPLSSGVTLRRPRANWDHLVLRSQRCDQLKEAVTRLERQAKVLDEWKFLEGRPGARGVRMLFVGPPGTGKTLSAEVIASALGVDLLIADVSRLISKWIGETPKNLSRVFDMAERSTAVILFDEADALFGKRTEVTDAHDRYANLETAYLLSRLERFEGMAILATNLRQNIDTAFLRRLEFIVDFEEPAESERERLWTAHIPNPAERLAKDVSFGELAAMYAVTGALIRNAAAAAAFMAAAEHSVITRGHLGHAMRREYEKAGRAFPGDLPETVHHDRTY